MSNYMKQVAEMLGVELGEEFRIRLFSETLLPRLYKITKNGLMCNKEDDRNTWIKSDRIDDLLTGAQEIIKLPWKPKNGDMYWWLDVFGSVWGRCWSTTVYDLMCFFSGNCFKTEKQAKEAVEKGELLAKLKKYYDEYDGEVEGDETDDSEEGEKK